MDPPSETPARKRRLSSFHLVERATRSGTEKTPRRPSLYQSGSASRRKSLVAGVTPRSGKASIQTPHSARSGRTPKSGGRTPRTPRTPRTGRTPQKLSAEDITALYATTIKLCQDNKINAKNSWSLNLIDYMGMLVRPEDAAADPASSSRKTNSEDVNFQLAGVTLDAGVRIYCSRVDSVHTNAFKVLTGLSRTGTSGDTEADGMDADGEDSIEDVSGAKRRRRGGVTLASNMGTITVLKMETDFAVDPLFQKMSAAYDEGGAKGMLLNTLLTESSGYILLDSDEIADKEEPTVNSAEEDATYDVDEEFPHSSFQANETLCYRFVSFFNARNGPLKAVPTPQAVSSDKREEQESSNVSFEYEQGDMQGDSALGVFPQTPSFPDGDDSFATDFDQDTDDYQMPSYSGQDELGGGRPSMDSSASQTSAALLGKVDLVEAGVALQTDSDYSFFDSMALSSWAGPQHWKFRSTTSASAKAGKESKRPRSKTTMLMDFSSEAPKIDFAAEFKSAKTATATMLTKTVLDGFSEKKVTLPDDLHYSVRDLTKLYLMPNVKVALNGAQRTVAVAQEDNSGESAWYDYDNDCDNENFCADIMDPMQPMGPDGDVQDVSSAMNSVSGMDLIAEPQMVDKIDISYAKVAKKVDLRKLKSGMWSHLCGGAEDAILDENLDVSNVLESENAADEIKKETRVSESQDQDIRTGVTQTLSELVHDLPDVIPGPALADVSVPYVFICLLHLANEKTLSICELDGDNINDLVITRDQE